MRRWMLGLVGLVMAAGQARAEFGFDPYELHELYGWGRAVGVGDVTGDGRDDVVVAKSPSGGPAGPGEYKIMVFTQTATGTLAGPRVYPLPVEQNVNALTLGDLNGDGMQDIIVGHYTGISVLTTTHARPGQLKLKTVEVGQGTTGVVTADVDRDGKLDIVAQGWGTAPMIYFGTGDGGLRDAQSLAAGTEGSGVNVGDVNRDGFPDLVSASSDGAIRAIFHNGVSGFLPGSASYDPGYVIGEAALGDFNHDGRQDIATGYYDYAPTDVSIFYQQSSGASFTTATAMPTAAFPSAMLGDDLNGDGRDDLLVIHGFYFVKLGYYLQGPSGLSSEVEAPLPGGYTLEVQGVATGDINSDGCKDVVLVDDHAGLVVLRGHDCVKRPDLSVALAWSASSMSIGLANIPGTESIASPLVTLDLSVRSGTLQLGTLPAQCVLQAQTATSRRVECLVDTLAPGATTSLTIPLSFSGIGQIGALTAVARAQTETDETTLENNRVSGKIVQQAAPSPISARRIEATRPPSRLRATPRAR